MAYNKDVEARVSRLCGGEAFGERFRVSHWWNVVNAKTEDDYEVALANLKSAWAWKHSVINYVETTWLNPHKTKFAKAWTNDVLHFGNTTTCRVESAHAALKAWLQTSTCDLHTLFTRVNLFIDSQMIKIRDNLEKSRCRISRQHMINPFRHLVGHVSHYCLNLLKMENTKRLNMGVQVFDYCDCVLVSSFGIPCACAIQRAINKFGGLYLNHIHLFFKSLVIRDLINASYYVSQCDQDVEYLRGLLDELSECDPVIRRGIADLIRRHLHPEDEGVQQPDVVTSTIGRPPGSSSTRRNPSNFEHVERELQDRSRSRNRTRTTTTTRSTREGDSSAANTTTRSSGDGDSNAIRTFEPERFERRAGPFPYAEF
ncbi:uncharacterized protein LOC104907376 [Beta vulgaris subsp. vulgaris]|uniref:uncharacterized protein LOC104907376 n=1 Tax=Beta vulgaris subsp. vulgaris TaxID=3555 RepID=UPI002036B2DF|nr:uncharacterized protein LOC104907376 [Beta vulgaris subsp. vulgaris]